MDFSKPLMPLIIAVDFDGTLCENAYPNIGKPKKNVIEKVLELKKKGCYIILWTCRKGKTLEEAVLWCKSHGLVFDAVNDQAPWIKEAFGCEDEMKECYENNQFGYKIFANYYVDDRAINVDDFEAF